MDIKEAKIVVRPSDLRPMAKQVVDGTIDKSSPLQIFKILRAAGKKIKIEKGGDTSRTARKIVIEKSVSKSQQKFFGMVRAVQKGDMKAPSPEVAKAAKSMKKKDVKDFASTKHKGLPEMKTFREMREGAMSKDKEKHDTGGFRISNADAKAARDRLAAKRKQKAQKSASQNKSFGNVRDRM